MPKIAISYWRADTEVMAGKEFRRCQLGYNHYACRRHPSAAKLVDVDALVGIGIRGMSV